MLVFPKGRKTPAVLRSFRARSFNLSTRLLCKPPRVCAPIPFARLCAPVHFVSLFDQCMFVEAVVVIASHIVYFVNLRDV